MICWNVGLSCAQILVGLSYLPQQNLAIVDFFSPEALPECAQHRSMPRPAPQDAKCVKWQDLGGFVFRMWACE
eukprot:scaffold6433_cov17-Tisochrysis_lutea.AAC.1